VPGENDKPVDDACGVFVSRSVGADGNAGTKEAPLKTLEQAKAPASKLRLVRADTGGGPARSPAPFAITSDGAFLINIDALDAIDAGRLEGRTFFIGAELAEGERELARKLLDGAGHELRSKIVWALAPRSAPKKAE
jgi:hypothetical protein